ncbi:MAG: alpha-amylase family glycosyl hydrolase [Cyanobacteria bacterium J06641_5]
MAAKETFWNCFWQFWWRLGVAVWLALMLWAGSAAPASARSNLDNDVLYYITVDRFFDGEPGNDRPRFAFESASQSPSYQRANRLLVEQAYDPTHRYINLFWGGDLEGVLQKLDYLQELGATKLVLSPIQDSANGIIYNPDTEGFVHVRSDPEREPFDPFQASLATAFQGDWPKDWFEIDEHFRNPADENSDRYRVLRRLLDAAGERGIGIILSLHCNHTSPVRYDGLYADFNDDRSEIWLTDNGAVYRHGHKVASYVDSLTGARNPDGWFHPPVTLDYARPTADSLERAQVGGIPDLAQENPEVRDYLLDATRFWLQFNAESQPIAGLYFDSIDNINLGFWQDVERVALETNPNAILIGQYPDGGYRNQEGVNWYVGTDTFTWLNYGLSDAARRFFARDRAWDGRAAVMRELSLGRQGEYYNYGWFSRLWHKALNPSESLQVPRQALDLIPDGDPNTWISFLETRDRPRLFSIYPNLSERAYASAMAFGFIGPGVPLLTYGVETGLAVPHHIDNSGMGGIGSEPYNQPMAIWPGDAGWNERLYARARMLAHLRQDYPVLRYGQTRYVFPRRARRDTDIFLLREGVAGPEVLLAYSTGGGRFQVPVTRDRGGCTYTELTEDIESIATSTTTISDRCEIPVTLEPEESRIFIIR